MLRLRSLTLAEPSRTDQLHHTSMAALTPTVAPTVSEDAAELVHEFDALNTLLLVAVMMLCIMCR